MPVAPITPDEAKKLKNHSIPDEVIKAFNDMIVEKLSSGRAVIKQKDVVARIVAATQITEDQLFDNHWLDVEDVFRKAGWTVKYDKPAYCENYDAYFEFSRKRN